MGGSAHPPRQFRQDNQTSRPDIKETTMTRTTKLILSAAFVAMLSAPASARIDGDEGGSTAYPFRGHNGVHMTTGDTHSWPTPFINRPRHQR
jgi:hypothetical protein